MTRCPPGPCRCWAAAPVWSGPRTAEPRFVWCHRSPSELENRRGDSRGESGLCDPRRSHATTGASVRLASGAHASTSTAPVARTTRSGVSHASGAGRRGPASERVRGLGTKSPDQERAATVFRPAEAGRGRPVPARRAHGSGEPFVHATEVVTHRPGPSRSQRLPSRSMNTATRPYASSRGGDTKRTPASIIRW